MRTISGAIHHVGKCFLFDISLLLSTVSAAGSGFSSSRLGVMQGKTACRFVAASITPFGHSRAVQAPETFTWIAHEIPLVETRRALEICPRASWRDDDVVACTERSGGQQ